MSTVTHSIWLPLMSACLFSGVFLGSFYAISSLAALRSTDNFKAIILRAATGFAPPLVMLFLWEYALHEVVSFDVILGIWLLLLVVSIVLLVIKPSKQPNTKSYAAGLLLGCCAFFTCAILLAMFD